MDAVTETEITSFDQLDLSPIMLSALRRAGYEKPTSIQAQVIPPALENLDIVGQARTGTGKTAAFGIPILEMLDPLSETRNPQALILVPTRELADQVHQEIVKLAYGVPTASVVMAGGKHMRRQIDQLAQGVQLVVGTPGRVLDHIGRRTMKLHDIGCVVLDEADRMLDIGFRPAIERILRACPTERQTMLLSATMPPVMEKLSERYLQNPTRINCSQSQVSCETIEQRYFTVRQEEKYDTLLSLLQREKPRQVIIFCRTKRGTDRLHRALQMEARRIHELSRMRMACIHGDMNQRDRDRVFSSLRAGELNLLVATDVVGRGIDVSTVSHIINYDIPLDCDDYVHRVGRTGRMGREGIAFTFVTNSEGQQLTAIELNINRLLVRDSLTENIVGAITSDKADASGSEGTPRDTMAAVKPLASSNVRPERDRPANSSADSSVDSGVDLDRAVRPSRNAVDQKRPSKRHFGEGDDSEPSKQVIRGVFAASLIASMQVEEVVVAGTGNGSTVGASIGASNDLGNGAGARESVKSGGGFAGDSDSSNAPRRPFGGAIGIEEFSIDQAVSDDGDDGDVGDGNGKVDSASGEVGDDQVLEPGEIPAFGEPGRPRRRKLFPMKRRTSERLAKMSPKRE